MRVLYLTPNFGWFIAAFFQPMIDCLGEYGHAEQINYGPNFPAFDKLGGSRDILHVVDTLGFKPDMVMMWDHEGSGWAGDFENLERLNCLKILWSVDVHKDAGSESCLRYIKEKGIGLILMSYDRELRTSAGQILKATGVPIEYYPFSVDPDWYKPLPVEKRYDISLVGSMAASYYPYRIAYDEILSKRADIRYHSPEMGAYYREDFVRHINESRITVTCSSSYKYPLPKYLEIMACDSLLFADTPTDAGYLHYVPGHNYVQVGPDNISEKVSYYLGHSEEATRIKENARQTVLAHHTNEKRAAELAATLRRYL